MPDSSGEKVSKNGKEHIMGDKGGKKDKNKSRKQKTSKQDQKVKKQQEKKQKSVP